MRINKRAEENESEKIFNIWTFERGGSWQAETVLDLSVTGGVSEKGIRK